MFYLKELTSHKTHQITLINDFMINEKECTKTEYFSSNERYTGNSKICWVVFIIYSGLVCFKILDELKQTQKVNTVSSYLEHDGKVCSFTCYIKKNKCERIRRTF